jgi:hypothetical protein
VWPRQQRRFAPIDISEEAIERIAMITLLRLVAILEGATGIALTINPDLVTRWLFGGGLSGAGLALSRVAGFALLALGLACWPDREIGSARTRTGGMLPIGALFTYSLLAGIYLAYLGIFVHLAGTLLWPAVAAHAAAVLLTAMMLSHARQH